VLAIAAWKLGARRVVAIDNDPDALTNARDNVARNDAPDAIAIEEIDLSTASLEPADLIVANLTGAILQRHAPALRGLAPRGTLLVSGFTTDEEDGVVRAFGVDVHERAQEGDWVALVISAGSSA
jgi:ribosomal protein L11 methyltransferase